MEGTYPLLAIFPCRLVLRTLITAGMDVLTQKDKDIIMYVLGPYQSDIRGILPDNRLTGKVGTQGVTQKILYRVLYFLYTMKKSNFNGLLTRLSHMNVCLEKMKIELPIVSEHLVKKLYDTLGVIIGLDIAKKSGEDYYIRRHHYLFSELFLQSIDLHRRYFEQRKRVDEKYNELKRLKGKIIQICKKMQSRGKFKDGSGLEKKVARKDSGNRVVSKGSLIIQENNDPLLVRDRHSSLLGEKSQYLSMDGSELFSETNTKEKLFFVCYVFKDQKYNFVSSQDSTILLVRSNKVI